MLKAHTAITRFIKIICSVFSFLGIILGMYFFVTAYSQTRLALHKDTIHQHFMTKYRVLYISSYEEGYTDPLEQEMGIRSVFADQNISLDILHLTSLTASLTEQQFLSISYDAILAGDDTALQFVEKYHSTVYKDIPVVFFNILDNDYGKHMAVHPVMMGSVVPGYFDNIIDCAMTLLPKATKILAIYDNTLSGLITKKHFELLKKKYPDYQFTGISMAILKKDLLITSLEDIQSDTIVLYVNFTPLSSEASYKVLQNSLCILQHCHVPVFTNVEGLVGHGMVGGFVLDHEAAGIAAAQHILAMLNDASLLSKSDVEYEKPRIIFDYEVMQRYGLDRTKLPAGTLVIHNQGVFFTTYKDILIPTCLITASLIILIVLLLIKRIESLRYIHALDVSHARLTFQTSHDNLTQLANRSSDKANLIKLIDSHNDFAILKIHIIGFKHINDSYTHACGDFVLQVMALRLKALEATGDFFAARVSGADFTLHYNKGPLHVGDEAYRKVEDLLSISFQYHNLQLAFKTAIGIVNSLDAPLLSVDELMTDVCLALDEARCHAEQSIAFYTTAMRERFITINSITAALENAIITDGFTMVYQPQVSIASPAITGYEALLRFKDNLYTPDVFISIAETSGYIIQIGRIVTEKVLFQLALWRDHGMPLHTVAVNFSAKQLDDLGFVAFLQSMLRKYKIPPSLIEIEITESLYLSNGELARTLFSKLAQLGINIVLDDFGTGYSSISYLTYLPVKKVKIDRTMTKTYLQEGKDTLIKNITTMVHDLGMKLTVEGVETVQQYKKLRDFHCDSVQGYLFSKPLSGDAIEHWTVAEIN